MILPTIVLCETFSQMTFFSNMDPKSPRFLLLQFALKSSESSQLKVCMLTVMPRDQIVQIVLMAKRPESFPNGRF